MNTFSTRRTFVTREYNPLDGGKVLAYGPVIAFAILLLGILFGIDALAVTGFVAFVGLAAFFVIDFKATHDVPDDDY